MRCIVWQGRVCGSRPQQDVPGRRTGPLLRMLVAHRRALRTVSGAMQAVLPLLLVVGALTPQMTPRQLQSALAAHAGAAPRALLAAAQQCSGGPVVAALWALANLASTPLATSATTPHPFPPVRTRDPLEFLTRHLPEQPRHAGGAVQAPPTVAQVLR